MLPRSKLSLRALSRIRKSQVIHTRSVSVLAPHLPPLPPRTEWPQLFPRPVGRNADGLTRQWLHNETRQIKCLQQFGLADTEGPAKTVIELYGGPGNLSRALLSLPRESLERLIIIEHGEVFHPELDALAAADDRVVLMKQNPYHWEVFEEIKKSGMLGDIKPVLDGSVHPQLRIVSQLPLGPTVEQLMSQWVRTVPTRSWMWSYGRIPLHLIMDEWLHTRMTATSSNRWYGKLSVLTNAITNITDLKPSTLLNPYESYFYPVRSPNDPEPVLMTGRAKAKANNPMVACTILPKAWDELPMRGGEEIDGWDFVLRNAFILRDSPIKKALAAVAPGASTLLTRPETSYIDPKTPVRKLTLKDWSAIMAAFQEWPFKPSVLVLPDAIGPRVGTGIMRGED